MRANDSVPMRRNHGQRSCAAKRAILVALVLLSVAGCSDGRGEGPTLDGGLQDTGATDGNVADTGTIDANLADTGVIDAGCQGIECFSGPVSLGVASKYYDIQADNNNVVHIIYLDGARRAWYGQIVNIGGTWQVANVEDTGATGVLSVKIRPRISVRPDGQEIHFTWVANTQAQATELKHCWKDTNGTWHTEIVETLTGGWYWQYPDVGIDSSGVTHMVAMKWSLATSPNAAITYKRKAPGESWTDQPDITPATTKNIWTAMFVDHNGRVHVVWNDNKIEMRYKYCESGDYLSSGTTITLPRDTPKLQRPEVFVDRNDNVHIVCNAHMLNGMDFHIGYWTKTMSETSFPNPVHVNIDMFTLTDYIPYPSVAAVSQERVFVSYAWDSDDTEPAEEVFVSTNDSTVGNWTVYPIGKGAFQEETRSVMAVTDDTVYMVFRGLDGNLLLETYDLN